MDLNSVRDDLASVVHRTLEPAHISIWTSEGSPNPSQRHPRRPHPASTSTDSASTSSAGSSIRLRISSYEWNTTACRRCRSKDELAAAALITAPPGARLPCTTMNAGRDVTGFPTGHRGGPAGKASPSEAPATVGAERSSSAPEQRAPPAPRPPPPSPASARSRSALHQRSPAHARGPAELPQRQRKTTPPRHRAQVNDRVRRAPHRRQHGQRVPETSRSQERRRPHRRPHH